MEEKLLKSDISQVLLKVGKALAGLAYGEIIIKVVNGKVTVIDRIERERVE